MKNLKPWRTQNHEELKTMKNLKPFRTRVCHSYSSTHLGFARGYFSFYMVFVTITFHFIWPLPQLLFILYGLCQGVLFILCGFCHSDSSLKKVLATVTLHFIWLLPQWLLILYGFCDTYMFQCIWALPGGFSPFYMAFAIVTPHCIWILPQSLFIVYGFSTVTIDFIWLLRHLLFNL